jgi:integrase
LAFNDKQIQAFKPRLKRYEIIEPGRSGLRLRVSPNGLKVFVFVFRFEGRLCRLTLNTYTEGAGALADARASLAEARQQLRQKINPAALKQSQQLEHVSAPTVATLAETYLERHAKARKQSWPEDERILNKDVLPDWKHRKAAAITTADVNAVLDAIVDRGSPVAANRTLAVIRKMFNFALQRGLVTSNPCQGIEAPGKEQSRQRVLTAAEIATLWGNLDKTPITLPVRTLLRLELMTAQRKGELVSAEWSDIDMKRGWWTIPDSKAKNGLAHRVPLTPAARKLLKGLPRIEGNPYVFPSRIEGRPLSESSVDNAVREHRDILGVLNFTPHDLRRTAASHMTSLGIPRLVVGKILNHAESHVTAVYDRHSYDQEKRAALDKWARRLSAIVSSAEKKPRSPNVRAGESMANPEA